MWSIVHYGYVLCVGYRPMNVSGDEDGVSTEWASLVANSLSVYTLHEFAYSTVLHVCVGEAVEGSEHIQHI